MDRDEYNFWDDRTTPDEFICPIIQGVCYLKNCDTCDEKMEFDEFYNNSDNEGR